jgi:hypothetical protein
LGYELNRFWEPVLPAPLPPLNDPVAGLPLLSLMQAEELVIFDHTSQTIHLVAHPSPDLDPREAYDEAVARLERLRTRLSRSQLPAERPLEMGTAPADLPLEEEWTRQGFCRGVEQAQGDIDKAAATYERAGTYFPVGDDYLRTAEGFAARGDDVKAWREADISKFWQPGRPQVHEWYAKALMADGHAAESRVESRLAQVLPGSAAR